MPSSANIPGALRTFECGVPLATCVTTASEAAARDLATIKAGTSSFTLMLQAGTRATEVILRDYTQDIAHGVIVLAGSGNNGGDAYVVAAQLARQGVRVVVVATKPPSTPDATRAAAVFNEHAQRTEGRCTIISVHEFMLPHVVSQASTTIANARIVVDGLLGTGHRGALRDDVRYCASRINDYRNRGATIVALDVPTGLDATTGEGESVRADVTVSFGTIKRGTLINREAAGRIVLVDIGLQARVHMDDAMRGHATAHVPAEACEREERTDNAWRYATRADLSAMLSTPRWDSHKGQRGRLAVIGGATGMAGAVMLATRGALHSGVGLIRAYVDGPSVPAMQSGVPHAIASAWNAVSDKQGADREQSGEKPWGTALAIGPGLGRDERSLAVFEDAFTRFAPLPMVIDADALTLLATQPALLEQLGSARNIVLTPHAGEFARLTGAPTPTEWQERADTLMAFVERTATTVLLKGTPTLIASPLRSMPVAVPRGTPVLATGGSGDLLTGIIGALLAQGIPAIDAAILGAHVHGRAAEYATTQHGGVRGVTLDDVLGSMPHVWREIAHVVSVGPLLPGVIEDLPFFQESL